MSDSFGIHPTYVERLPDWTKMRDTYKGERKIKEEGEKYLPATAGQKIDGMNTGQDGLKSYEAYKTRAVFPDLVREAIETLVGMIHKKPARIELPEKLKFLLEKATPTGEDLQGVLRKINEEQFAAGRLGLLLDFPEENKQGAVPEFYFLIYQAEFLPNWDEKYENDRGKLSFVVIDETRWERGSNFAWVKKPSYRLLMIGDIKETVPEDSAEYQVGVFENSAAYDPAQLKKITVSGKTLNEIPFSFVNPNDMSATPDVSPLLGLAELCLAIYRLEADYRQGLHNQSQDTLVVIDADGTNGSNGKTRIGAGACINLGMGGDAKFIGTNSAGLSEQRQAIAADKSEAKAKAGHFIASGLPTQESGDALRTRLAAQTATLTNIAKTSAAALEKLLKLAAVWIGEDPAKVKVIPNLEFYDTQLQGQDLLQIVVAKLKGAPISWESIHDYLKQRGLSTKEFDDEMAKINKEEPIAPPAAAPAPASGAPNNQDQGLTGTADTAGSTPKV